MRVVTSHTTKLTPVETIPAFAVILRAIWTRGKDQQDALGVSTGWCPILLAMKAGEYGSSDTIRADEKIDRVVVLD